MVLPLTTTRISILRPIEPAVSGSTDPDGWPPQPREYRLVAQDIPAVISSAGGTTVREGSLQTVLGFRLAADPCDLQHIDHVLDQGDGSEYELNWVHRAPDVYGLGHVRAELRRVEGFHP